VLRGRGGHIEYPPAVRAGAPAGDAPHQLGVVDFELHDGIERLAQRLEQPVERLRLGEIAREAIENEAATCVALRQALTDHAEHQRILYQPATFHGRLGLAPEVRAAGNRSAQQIAGGDLRNVLALHESLRLGAFAGTGGTQQDDAHMS